MFLEKNKFPLVSVAIITYNQKNFLRECIESVLSQDYPNFEIIVADDASTDGTQNLLLEYLQQYSDNKFILRLNKENLGVTKNSNVAYSACSGKYIAWMGGDDLMLPGKLAAQVNWLEQDPNRALCGHRAYLCNANGDIYGEHKSILLSGKGPKVWIEKGTLYTACSVMTRKSYMPAHGFDERLTIVSDWKLWIDTLKNGATYGYLNEIYSIYRKHNKNITNIENRESLMKDIKLTLSLIEKEYSSFFVSIKKGRSYVEMYGTGWFAFRSKDFKKAATCFLKSIFIWPFQYKAYLRLIQTVILPKNK